MCVCRGTSLERARDLKRPPVRVLGTGFASEPVSGDDCFTQPGGMMQIPGARLSADRALAQAGINRDDLDFAELYDCFTISCLLQIEDLGFCARGEGPHFIREKGIGIDGELPINTHGGLLSHSYLLGVEHVLEAVRQLRGEAGAAQVKDAESWARRRPLKSRLRRAAAGQGHLMADNGMPPEFTGFFQAACKGKIAFPRCGVCGRFHWYPMPRCPHCRSRQLAWQPIAGVGEILASPKCVTRSTSAGAINCPMW